MSRALSYLTPGDAVKNTILGEKLEDALHGKPKKAKIVKLKSILDMSECANEILIILRLLSGETTVSGFEDPEQDYTVDFHSKIGRISDFISSLGTTDIQDLLGYFSIQIESSKKIETADKIQNLIEQDRRLEAMIILFNMFGGEYTEATGKSTAASRVILSMRLKFYTSTQKEFVDEHGVQYIIPEIKIQQTQDITRGRIESTLTGKTKLKKIDKLLKDKLQGLEEALGQIQELQELYKYLQLVATLKTLNERSEKIFSDGKKIHLYLLGKPEIEAQRESSEKRLTELAKQKESLNEEIIKLKKQLEDYTIKVVPTIGNIRRIIYSFCNLGETLRSDKDSFAVDLDVFTIKKRLLTRIFIEGLMVDHRANYEIISGLGDIVTFYEKCFTGKQPSLVSLEERTRFTPEYITSVFERIYTQFPQLNITE